ncbi:MAG: phosphoenolpyruvate carboxykinase (ATP) [Pseudopedobacter saltans]|uniref:Phosphoenolpyruvate carboxykinase (ATP) n=1 Tax=Pseudopedobacter saltans TaxID=151895 RepID=A0A2W5GID5_9SPHI|nr:MAG: phosphoenolpyruvate carboxykinase (ATP) [Pseudopedobacter saltans]
MRENGKNSSNIDLKSFGLNVGIANWNLSPEKLIQQTIDLKQGVLNDTGALCVNTGKFTGRSPKDKFIVKDSVTEKIIDWGNINIPIAPYVFESLYNTVCKSLENKEVWVRNVAACADSRFQISILAVNETPWANLFCDQLFLRPSEEEMHNAKVDWLILQVPSFDAEPAIDGTRSENFTMINFSRKVILIGGSGYTGEMKKGIFSVLNFVLPYYDDVLPMHCAANEGEDGDVALFFGLSGTGKTTLSTDAHRKLIGDDEHGWSDSSIFNFEGGCYAKCINLSKDHEPQIYNALKNGSLIENVVFFQDSNMVNFDDDTITENTRAAYPIHHIENAKEKSCGGVPKNIFFLTCDASGVLPPISKLTKGQAMYHFLSGYTAKVAGTEMGISEPESTFSACFGNVFLPLHPVKYANILGKKLDENPDIKVWLVNTGWTGGSYGFGKRISLKYTRQLIKSAIDGALDHVAYNTHSVFGLAMPSNCPEVPSEILNPENTWANKAEYDAKAIELAGKFIKNFEKYQAASNVEILDAAPTFYKNVS